ncbi:MAG: 50S ribosomal protein L5 [Candidatus Omnitrophica bacterium]|nr:50S ribosomal protein L5 [Candidatus Omnitrophota bacterium]MBD3268560.1 50S ribosomal protein L5 [Candidatus Omnitrophota bacterium]
MSASDLKEKYVPRLLQLYKESILPEMKKERGYSNDLAVPRLVKIVVNMGLGSVSSDPKAIEQLSGELAVITGQKAKICRARKPISNFKLRKGMGVGCCTTLRKSRMYEFLDRLITVAIPRIRDFRGFSSHAFDGSGNYAFGLAEQGIFPEINLDKVSRTQGMNIVINTNAVSDEECRLLLEKFGFPFRR